jgi:hypothetical protein
MLTPVGPDLWAADHLLRLPGGVRMPLRMTVARLEGGGLWVHSPIPLDDPLAAALAGLGPVRVVVAPNSQHHLFVAPFLRRFPGARLLGARPLLTKRADLPLAAAILDEPAAPGLEQTAIDGAPRMSEVVFFHRPSRSLVVSDLLFNVTHPATWATGLLLRITGTRGRLAMSRVWRFVTQDRAALAASVERVLAWDFTCIVPGHGDVLAAADARAQARVALRWALAGAG